MLPAWVPVDVVDDCLGKVSGMQVEVFQQLGVDLASCALQMNHPSRVRFQTSGGKGFTGGEGGGNPFVE